MISFEQLKEQSESLSLQQQRSKRSRRAEALYQRALTQLIKADIDNYDDPEELALAFEGFATALHLNTQDPRPYFMCAYLSFLIQDITSAREYLFDLKQLLGQSHELIELFEEAINTPIEPSDEEATFISQRNKMSSSDYDLLYEHTAETIQKVVHEVLQIHIPLPSTDAAQFKQVQSWQAKYERLLEQIQTQIKVIDEEIEVSDLEYMLRPLRTILKRFETTSRLCDQKLLLQEQIQRAYHQAEYLEQCLAQRKRKDVQSLSDQILDECDRLADNLDNLSEQVSIEDLEAEYTKLIQYVQALQESLDDCV